MSTAPALLVAPNYRKAPLAFLARVLDNAGNPVTQTSVSAVTCAVYDLDANAAPVTPPPTYTVSGTVFNSLQTADPRWTADAVGYNFLAVLPASCFPQAHTYQVEFKVAPASGDPFPLVVRVPCSALYSF